jgi:hypothetical protein
MDMGLSDGGCNGRVPARTARTRHRNPAYRSGVGLVLISVIVAGWMFVRADAANSPPEQSDGSAAADPALLTADTQNVAREMSPGQTPSRDAEPVRGVQESSIAPAETSGDKEGLSRPAARAARAVASVDGLKVVRQALRRGGLGSKALMTLTIRNSNDYPVKHIELLCAFRSRDGDYVTRRRHLIDGVVKPNSRRTFRHLMVGFVSINANQAKCSLLSADWA